MDGIASAGGEQRFIRWPDLQPRLGNVRFETVWRWERDGDFPARVKIGPNAVAWRESEVAEWAKSPADYRKKHGRKAKAAAA